MKTQTTIRLLVFVKLVALASSCAFAPVNGHYETAETLGKNNVEVAAGYTRYNSLLSELDQSLINQNLGVRLGIGLSDRVDLKLQYERLMPPPVIDEYFSNNAPIDFYSIAPKWSSKYQTWAFKTPISLYALDGESLMTIGFSAFRTRTVSDDMNLTIGLHNQNIVKMDSPGGVYPMLGLSFGMGFGPIDKWQIRPELGFLSDPFLGSLNLNYGVACVVQLGSH